MRQTNLAFTGQEKKDLLQTWALVSAVFILASKNYDFPGIIFISIIAISIGGLSVILHELAHKAVALRFGCSATFKADNKMTPISLIVAFFGLILLAPGAVHIQGIRRKKDHGIISLAGPGSNIILALISIAGLLTIGNLGNPLLEVFFRYGLMINTWLALFNLIPIPPLDGRAVWQWSKPIYCISAALCILLIIVESVI